jgi:hypothetical protein
MRRHWIGVVAVVATALLAPAASAGSVAAPASTWQAANEGASASGTLTVLRVGLDRIHRVAGTLVVGAGGGCHVLEVQFSSGGSAELARRCGPGSKHFSRDYMHLVPSAIRLCREGGACTTRRLSLPLASG